MKKVNDKNQLPLVEFEYPDSETCHQKLRYVRVLSMDDKYIQGYEVYTEQFKKYCLSRIVRNGVHLVQFEDKQIVPTKKV